MQIACITKWLSVCMLVFLFNSVHAQQLRLGDLGTSVTSKAAVLELNSSKQGLLLTRVPGTALAAAPLNTAPAGMIVFNTTDTSLYVRVGSTWQKLTAPNVSPAYYSLAGAATNTILQTPMKIIVDSVTNISSGLPFVNIPAGFYTQIVNIQATAKGGNTANAVPIVAVYNYTTTRVTFAVIVGNPGLLGLGNSVVMDGDVTHKIYYTITGY
ncbi:hypothetical protein SAMN05444266_10681 [Chitinophaga jiangningensis]|uniref:DUF4382 domain-containing protein n=1 Tax=Chitinophaga jiangningensis TaxID=1419482 RepID=A0A1M7FD45_9BACT|nr:hypothetical protein [Chitinophaga jiangningensis]SHM01587.1 hypothetical protein SAMN05444266_10681 [Chitinophaga jiangningensis]